ncbi:MAG TPA: SIMPL domain-containing protein [Paracoccaceae bacterium]|nr:SIMPL domain-containing protein [Paracoccaceae bacterium]
MGKKMLIIILGLFFAHAAAAQDNPRVLTVSGMGEVSATPDIVSISVGVEETRELASEALRATSRQMQEIFAILDTEGITGADRQTTQLALNAAWDRSQRDQAPQVVGYTASSQLMIRLQDIARLGEVLDALGQAGANRIQSINFAISDPGPMQDQARIAAVQDARAKAELYAEAAGVKLGAVLEISESGGTVRPVTLERMAMADAVSMPVAEGQLSLSASVTIRFAIE